MKRTLLTVTEAAIKLSLTPQQVRSLCRSGKIKAEQIGRSWVIDKEKLYSYYGESTCGVAEDQSNYYTKDQIKLHTKPKVLSFFSGAMGLDLGLEKAGFETLLCCEIDNASRKTILKNKPNVALIGNIADYTATEIRKNAGLTAIDEIDLVVGGPPCQSFSTAGKRASFEDERGNALLIFLNRIIELQPRYAVIENVRGILSAPLKHRPHNIRGVEHPPLNKDEQGGSALKYILERLKRAGYGVSFNLYNSANFGTPQKRERVIIICSRDGVKLPYLTPTHSLHGEFGLPKWKTFKEAVKDLSKKSHHHLEFPAKRLKYYKLLSSGQYWKHLPERLQKEALGASFYSGGGKTGFLRRLAWNEPAPTLVTHPAMPATDLAHPSEDRPLSIEEYKRIQEFPDNWKIEGSLTEQYKQVGNAVPVSLGYAVGKLIMNQIKGEKNKSFEGFQYSRYQNTNEMTWEYDFKKRAKQFAKQLELL